MTDKLIEEIDVWLGTYDFLHDEVDGLHKEARALLHQCRDRMPEPNSVTMPRSVYEMMTNRKCKRCGHQPQPPQQAEHRDDADYLEYLHQQPYRRPTGHKDADGNDICEGDTLENGLGDIIGEVRGDTVGPDNWPLSNVEMVRVRVVAEQEQSG